MKSIQARLGWSLGGALIMILLVSGLALYMYMRYVLLSGFDTALYDKARLFAAGTESLGDDAYDFEMLEAHMPEHWPGYNAEYVEFRDVSGKVLLRSPSLQESNLGSSPATIDGPLFSDVILPDGGAGRLITFGFVPRPEEGREGSTVSRLSIAVAISRAGVDSSLRRILGGLAVGAIILIASVFVALWSAIRLGLRPLGRIAEQVSEIGPTKLTSRFETSAIPDELLPIVERLNELLARLQAAFERERRFTADAAHELRTPVAELRTLAEVGLLETQPTDVETRGYLTDTLAIAKHLEGIITGLLALARFESDRKGIALQGLDLASILRQTFASQDLKVGRPDLQVGVDLPVEAIVLADENLVRVLLENLLSNVATYADADGFVALSLHENGDSWLLQLSNTATDLDTNDLAHLLEPFWRKSADRGEKAHVGLGLALVSECARLMHVEMRASLQEPSIFLIETVWAAAST